MLRRGNEPNKKKSSLYNDSSSNAHLEPGSKPSWKRSISNNVRHYSGGLMLSALSLFSGVKAVDHLPTPKHWLDFLFSFNGTDYGIETYQSLSAYDYLDKETTFRPLLDQISQLDGIKMNATRAWFNLVQHFSSEDYGIKFFRGIDQSVKDNIEAQVAKLMDSYVDFLEKTLREQPGPSMSTKDWIIVGAVVAGLLTCVGACVLYCHRCDKASEKEAEITENTRLKV